MKVQVVKSTQSPERVVCTAARGDYYDGFVGETDFYELMDSVDYDDRHVGLVKELSNKVAYNQRYIDIEASIAAFVEKQLSRGHFGPWEHPQISIAIKGVSRATMAQITRHRHLTFDVQSQRYVDFSDKEAIMPRSLEEDDHFSREDGLVDLAEEVRQTFRQEYEEKTERLFEVYQEMVDEGVPKEDARFLLPIGTPVNMTLSGNARTMMHVLNLRQKADAQWEIRELSNEIVNVLENWIPYTEHWWAENGPVKISP
ncbi:MAG: thymidylate synthase, flavin-dependent [Candidatus Nanosalina sp. J07AB43]|nr:MAG: thymidylate synthase, flavin-dependent [Candidatus Nanosalina sp. J07AB43]